MTGREPWFDGAVTLVERHAGLRVDRSTETRLAQAVVARAQATGRTPSAYVLHADGDRVERQHLLETFAVGETSFFRDPAQFDALTSQVLPALQPPVVVWSAGCSTGQEAYSLAIALEEAGVARWEVVASDLSGAALERARAGRYSASAMRGVPDGRRARWFRRDGEEWVVAEALRKRVGFARHNLADETLPVASGSCSVVFCRNVLIYLSAAATLSLLDRLHAALVPGGWLFVGQSEALWRLSDRFEPVRMGEVFAYRRLPDDARSVAVPAAAAAAPAAPAAPVARTAAELVDAGGRARRDGDVRGAASCFRRAAALEPDNPLAHVHLGLALEALGEPAASRRAFLAARAALARCDRSALALALEGFNGDELDRLVEAKLADG